MQIRYFATIRDITGERTLRWNRSAATLGELLHDLCGRYNDHFRSWVLDGDGLRLGKAIIILVNGYDVRHLAGINTPLKPGDTVAIFPMVAGG